MIREILNEVQQKHRNIVAAIQPPQGEGAGTNIFMGIGVAQRKGTVSTGLGIGTIGMAVTAIESAHAARRRNARSKINILIADGHAERFATTATQTENIKNSANHVTGVIQKLFSALGEQNICIMQSSDSTQWPMSQRKSYPEMEADDIEHARTVLEAGIKVGWQSWKRPIIGPLRWDERDFDQFARKNNPNLAKHMGFIRTLEGIKTEKDSLGNHHLAPPYIGSEDFALGQAMPDVRKRLKEIAVGNIFHNLIVNLGNSVTRLEGRSPRGIDPFEQVQKIVDACAT